MKLQCVETADEQPRHWPSSGDILAGFFFDVTEACQHRGLGYKLQKSVEPEYLQYQRNSRSTWDSHTGYYKIMQLFVDTEGLYFLPMNLDVQMTLFL